MQSPTKYGTDALCKLAPSKGQKAVWFPEAKSVNATAQLSPFLNKASNSPDPVGS